MAGQISFQFEPIATALPLLGDGRLKALAVTSLERAATCPTCPPSPSPACRITKRSNLLGLIAPAATPAPVIDHLSKAMKQVLEDPTVIKRFADLGTEARFTSASALC
jgi:tripartite-type tricarboxylate transporter receptor subunit TctC